MARFAPWANSSGKRFLSVILSLMEPFQDFVFCLFSCILKPRRLLGQDGKELRLMRRGERDGGRRPKC
jgi:hypothetical protein